MRKIFALGAMLAALAIWVSSAQAINIKTAEVINGVAVVAGGKAAANAPIRWQGSPVTTSNRNGGFDFGFAEVPASCVGTLSDGVTTMRVLLENCTPFDVVPKTGQTTNYATGDDGNLQKGVASPNPRFTDNADGTVTDNLTGLIWLKNANCLAAEDLGPFDDADVTANDGRVIWQTALNFANQLKSNDCGLTDGSVAGDWRLPNVRELQSLVDYGNHDPSLPTGHPFDNLGVYIDPVLQLPASLYWSSTTNADNTFGAWNVDFRRGDVLPLGKLAENFVLAVRGGS